MPKVLETKLKRKAKKGGLSKKRTAAYVYGTLRKTGWKSNFLRMYQEVLNVRLDRRDRISMRPFEDKPLVVEVVSIARDSHQDPMAEVNHYSRVKRVLQVEEVIPF